jgi:hypothetical protein
MWCDLPMTSRARRHALAACAVFTLAFVPAIVFAAKSDPWAEIKVGDAADDGQGEYDVTLVAINGSRDFPSKSLYEFVPGAYQLRIASRKRGKSGETVSLPFAIEVQPCVRYTLIADHQHESEGRKWHVAIKSETEVESCMKKFGERLVPATGGAIAGGAIAAGS